MKEDIERYFTTPPADILKILLLERRNHAFDSIEWYQKENGINTINLNTISMLRSRVYTLFMDISPSMMDDPPVRYTYDDVRNLVLSKNVDDVIKSMEIINSWMYNKGLTKFDNQRRYDSTRMENENREKGL